MVKASLEQLWQADREERHAWRLVDAEQRTKLAGFRTNSRGTGLKTSRAENAPPAAEVGRDLDEQPTVTEQPTFTQQPAAHSCGGRRGTGEGTCVSGHQTEPPAEGKRTRPGEGPTHSISTF